ncbi:uncharacterized protein LOC135402392 isoform X2 [Pseudopipra pipra]|uniref:uncharacterized protein LOC135402392 isoform X2 n=1 Tax=Pseudopipra pipra TaxID=415032 RepID=UPI003138C685
MAPKGGAGNANPCAASSPRGLGRSSSGPGLSAGRTGGSAWLGKGAEGRGPGGPCRARVPHEGIWPHKRSGSLSLSWQVASWDRLWRVVAPGGCHTTLHCTERGVGSGPAGPPCPGGAMGRQRSPPGPWWGRPLRAGCWWLLWLCGTALRGLRWLWSLTWVLLICYKSCWDSAFQVTEELGTSLQLRLEGSEEEEEENGSSDSALEPGQPVAQWQGHGDAGEAVLERLEGLEADVRFLCTELGAEKLLWSSRFLELLREQQSLRQRLQELPWQWNRSDSPELLGEVEDQSASGSEGESPEGRQWTEPLWQPRGTTQPDGRKRK